MTAPRFGSAPALAALAGAALIGFSPILVRLSELGPQATSFWRFVFALPILALAFLGAGAAKASMPAAPLAGLMLFAGILFGADIGLWSAALDYTTVANATLLSNMTPLFAALAGLVLFGERLRWPFLVGAIAALVGASLLALGRAEPNVANTDTGWFGDGLALFSALWYAGYLLMVRAQGANLSLVWLMIFATLGALLFALCATIALGETLWPRTLRGWLILMALGALVQVLGQGLIAYGVARLPITVSTILLWVQPLSAAILSWLMFAEPLGPRAFAGAICVLGGIYIVQRARPPTPAPTLAPAPTPPPAA